MSWKEEQHACLGYCLQNVRLNKNQSVSKPDGVAPLVAHPSRDNSNAYTDTHHFSDIGDPMFNLISGCKENYRITMNKYSE